MNQNPERTKESGEAAANNQAMPGGVIRVDEEMIRSHLDKVVVSTVEQTLNAMLDAEAALLCKAGRYEHTDQRVDTRAGHYERRYHTKAGEVTLRMPKLRKLPFETAIIECYRRRESSVEEALVEMYLAGVSVRRVEDITEALWGSRVSPSTLSELNQKIAAQIDAWRRRRIEGDHAYVYLGLCPVRGKGRSGRGGERVAVKGGNVERKRERREAGGGRWEMRWQVLPQGCGGGPVLGHRRAAAWSVAAGQHPGRQPAAWSPRQPCCGRCWRQRRWSRRVSPILPFSKRQRIAALQGAGVSRHWPR
ncbi:MAG: transposase [Puniceicoccales bacterium]|jgi:hypothetical protein|nr:transposase [Puniceicoccales bacterium]